MFENKLINGIHKSRYIASWLKAGGTLYYGNDFDDFFTWLLSEGMTENEAHEIVFLAMNGKMELENSAKQFMEDTMFTPI